MDEKNFDTNEAAAYLGCSPAALRLWRSQGRGPRFNRLERKLIRYRRSELDRWVEKQSREPWQGKEDDTKKPN